MSKLGKVDREFFDSVIYPNLGADRDDVRLGPTHGVDFGVLEVGGKALVVATDPISILPELGWERAGRLALEIVLADVAVSGIAPTHLAISLSLPPEMTDAELTATWRGIADHAESLGVNIVSGHTARYSGVEFPWVGGATALGVGDLDDVVRPDGAQVGDSVVMSTGPGAEVAGLFSILFPDALGLTEDELAVARERVEDIRTVADATAVGDAAVVSAMHDATEGGVIGALEEMARGAGVRFDIDRSAAPNQPGVQSICNALDVDPWAVTSAGTLLVTAPPTAAEAVVDALEANGTPAAIVGTVSDGEGVYLDGERVEPPESDPSWAAMEELLG